MSFIEILFAGAFLVVLSVGIVLGTRRET